MVALGWDGSRDICYFMNISIYIVLSLRMKPKEGDDIPSCSRTETLEKDSFIKGLLFYFFFSFCFPEYLVREQQGSFDSDT